MLDEYTPAAFNDPQWTAVFRKSLVEALGSQHVHTHQPTLGGEDFGQYSRMLKIPGVMFKVGASDASKLKARQRVPGLHSDRYVPVLAPTLRTGIFAVSVTLLKALEEG